MLEFSGSTANLWGRNPNEQTNKNPKLNPKLHPVALSTER